MEAMCLASRGFPKKSFPKKGVSDVHGDYQRQNEARPQRVGSVLLALVSCEQGCGRFLGIESGEKKEVEIKG